MHDHFRFMRCNWHFVTFPFYPAAATAALIGALNVVNINWSVWITTQPVGRHSVPGQRGLYLVVHEKGTRTWSARTPRGWCAIGPARTGRFGGMSYEQAAAA